MIKVVDAHRASFLEKLLGRPKVRPRCEMCPRPIPAEIEKLILKQLIPAPSTLLLGCPATVHVLHCEQYWIRLNVYFLISLNLCSLFGLPFRIKVQWIVLRLGMKLLAEIHSVDILAQPRWGIDFLHLGGPRIYHVIDLLLRVSLAIEFVSQGRADLAAASDTCVRLVTLVILLELDGKRLDLSLLLRGLDGRAQELGLE